MGRLSVNRGFSSNENQSTVYEILIQLSRSNQMLEWEVLIKWTFEWGNPL